MKSLLFYWIFLSKKAKKKLMHPMAIKPSDEQQSTIFTHN